MLEAPLPRIILLTDKAGAYAMRTFLHFQNPKRNIVHVVTHSELNALPLDLLCEARLIGVATEVIVSARILHQLGYGAYNFRAGPPDYPGWAPASFAIYDCAPTFGATAHEMIEKVNAGPIIGTEIFALPKHFLPHQLECRAFEAMMRLFRHFGPALARNRESLPTMPLAWSGRGQTRADFNRMCEFSADLGDDERIRRQRAFISNTHQLNSQSAYSPMIDQTDAKTAVFGRQHRPTL